MTPDYSIAPNPFWPQELSIALIVTFLLVGLWLVDYAWTNRWLLWRDIKGIFKEPTPEQRQVARDLEKYYPRYSRSFKEPAAKGGDWRSRVVPIDEARRRKQLDAFKSIGDSGRVA